MNNDDLAEIARVLGPETAEDERRRRVLEELFAAAEAQEPETHAMLARVRALIDEVEDLAGPLPSADVV